MLFNAILIFAIRKTILDKSSLSGYLHYTYMLFINLVIEKLDRDIFFFYCSFLLASLPRTDKAVNSFATNCLHIVSASADVSRPISRSPVIAPFKQFSRQTDLEKF